MCVCLNYGIKELIKSSVFNASFSERNRIKKPCANKNRGMKCSLFLKHD